MTHSPNHSSSLVDKEIFAHFIAWRFYLVLSLIILISLGLGWRVFDLAIIKQSFLQRQSDARALRTLKNVGLRGMILDRHQAPLAISAKVYSIWINPLEFNPYTEKLGSLANLLDMKPKNIDKLVRTYQKKKRGFAYLKRGLSPDVAHRIRSLNISGLYLQAAYRRYYPEGEITAQVLGFTNVDDQGQEGLELGYNQWLAGQSSNKKVVKDRIGRSISTAEQNIQFIHEKKTGNDLILSIDKQIQYLAYKELLAGVIKNQASSASLVVLDVKTGEVLAMVNQPSFNPNERPIQSHNGIRNRALTDTFEPGSTIKAFTVAAALESGRFQPDSIVNTSPGWMRVGHNLVRDEKNNGLLTMTEVLQLSSNMGAAKLVLSLPPSQLPNLLHKVGFGEITGVGFPGEQSGFLLREVPRASFTLATLSFGYGLSVTALQLARAYAIIANGGIKLPVSILRLDKPPQGTQVMSTKAAHHMLMLLESVVLSGTGKAAQVPGYRIAGKTGTTKMVGVEGYQKYRHNSSFVGIAPINDPRIVVAVVLQDLQGKKYYGGQVSAPIFKNVMAGTLRIMAIAPDK